MTDFQRRATSMWNGDLESGEGEASAASGAFSGLEVTFATRFVNQENEGKTNPEELIAAAHAACFNMKFSGVLAAGGHEPESLHTQATVTLSDESGDFRVSRVHLETEGTVPGIDESAFMEAAEVARDNCPISNLLAPGLDEITMEARLAG